MNKSFALRIAAMNAMYRLPANDYPVLPEDVVGRLTKFKATLMDEVHEIDQIVELAQKGAPRIDILVAMADLLGDVIVYCRSEALKYGLPMVPAYGTRIGENGEIAVEFEAPIPHTDPDTMTRAFNDSLSARILAHPEQWYWLLRRWTGA